MVASSVACPVFGVLGVVDVPLPVWGFVCMNDYGRAAVWVALIAGAAYSLPRIVHLWHQQKASRELSAALTANGTDIEWTVENIANGGDDGGYV